LIIRSSYISHKYKINNSNISDFFENNINSKNQDTNIEIRKLVKERVKVLESYIPVYEKNLTSIVNYSKKLKAEPIFITNLLPQGDNAPAYSKELSGYLNLINNRTISTCKKLKIKCFDLRDKVYLSIEEDYHDPMHTTPAGSAKIGKLIAKLFLEHLKD